MSQDEMEELATKFFIGVLGTLQLCEHDLDLVRIGLPPLDLRGAVL
jgi:hypothetical protein